MRTHIPERPAAEALREYVRSIKAAIAGVEASRDRRGALDELVNAATLQYLLDEANREYFAQQKLEAMSARRSSDNPWAASAMQNNVRQRS